MTIAYIGSIALKHHICVNRISADTDIVGDFDSIQKLHKSMDIVKAFPFEGGTKYFAQERSGAIWESEIAWDDSLSEELLQLIVDDPKSIRTAGGYVASLDALYMLKMSHRYLRNSPHFRKTMKDAQNMRSAGAVIRSEHEDFFKRREAATYNYSAPKLNQSKADFFSSDGIVYEWDHDTIHEAVKFFDKPAYTYFSGGEVWSDMKKFKTLPMTVRLHAVLEESLVLAAERSQLAFPDADITPEWSFLMALSKVCTSITSGMFREFAWENYDKVVAMYNEKATDYMGRVHAGIASGVVKKL